MTEAEAKVAEAPLKSTASASLFRSDSCKEKKERLQEEENEQKGEDENKTFMLVQANSLTMNTRYKRLK